MTTFNFWVSQVILWGGGVGQTVFVMAFLTRPWRKYPITRAWMHKSIAWMLVFWLGWVRYLVRGPQIHDDPTWLVTASSVITLYVLWAVWNQLFALIQEVRSSKERAELR